MVSKRAVIGLILILFAGIIFLREFAWWQQKRSLQERNTVSFSLRLIEPVRVTPSNCIIDYRGESVLVPLDLCEGSELMNSRLGNRITIFGSYRRQMINGEIGQKGWFIADKVEVIYSPWKWLENMVSVRTTILSVFTRLLPEPQASLVAGIVLGAQSNLPESFKKALIKTGTMHIVAASGYNVAVVIQLILSVTVTWWGRRRGIFLSGLLLILYVFLAGASPPILRAGLMGIIMLLSVYFGRSYWGVWSLVLVCFVLLMTQPWLLVSISFQLSTVATLGVLMYQKQNPNIIHDSILNEVWVGLLESFKLTFVAVIMTTPISIIAFGYATWLGLLVNPFVLWLVPPLMYLGGALLVSGFLWMPLAVVFSWIVTPMATVMIELIYLCSRLPFENIPVVMNWWMAFGWWMIWIGIWSFKR